MIVACCLAPFLVSLGLYIAWDYHVSKKIIFRTVGADATWQGMLTRLLAFQDVLKFDLQLGVSTQADKEQSSISMTRIGEKKKFLNNMHLMIYSVKVSPITRLHQLKRRLILNSG